MKPKLRFPVGVKALNFHDVIGYINKKYDNLITQEYVDYIRKHNNVGRDDFKFVKLALLFDGHYPEIEQTLYKEFESEVIEDDGGVYQLPIWLMDDIFPNYYCYYRLTDCDTLERNMRKNKIDELGYGHIY